MLWQSSFLDAFTVTGVKLGWISVGFFGAKGY
jgi:hypothetical protein